MKSGPKKGITLTSEHKRKIGESNRRRFRENRTTRERVLLAISHARLFRAAPRFSEESTADGSRRKRYGLTRDEFETLLAAQDRKCGICRRPLEDRKGQIAVDHDHATEAVRGLLCVPCNGALGWFEQHKDAAAEYLRQCAVMDCK